MWPLLAISVFLFTWALIIRQPVNARYLKVSARSQLIAATPDSSGGANVSAEQVTELRRQVDSLSSVVVSRRKDILPLLTQLESNARNLGWRAERVMKSPQAFPNGITNLTLHPVVLRLQPAAEIAPGLHARLLDWLQMVRRLDKRAGLAALTIQAGSAGIIGAEARLHFFSLPAHEETAAK